MKKRKRRAGKKALLKFHNNVFNGYMRDKLVIFVMAFFAITGMLIIRIANMQNSKGTEYAKYVLNNQRYDSTILPFKRGDIRDRSGTVLAYSSKVYNLILDPKVILYTRPGETEMIYKEPTIEALLKCFNLSREEIENVLEKRKEYNYVKVLTGLTDDDIAPFKKLMEGKSGKSAASAAKDEEGGGEQQTSAADNSKYINGVWFEEEYIRSYPYKSLACDVIGFASTASMGEIGLENYYNDYLAGTNGVTYGYVNEDLKLEKTTKAPVDGYNIITTLDFSVQSIIEKHILKFNEEYGSKNTAVIVMDPNNGEIIAEASYPVFDLNNPRDLSSLYTDEEWAAMENEDIINAYYSLWKNFCVSAVYEPGSTMKPFTVAAGLEEGKLFESDVFHCDGVESILGHEIHCHIRYGHNDLTLEQTIMQSCNDALMQMGLKLGAGIMEKYQDIFGYGRKTYVDLPGEEAGITKSAKDMDDSDIATNAFGQNLNVTMTQLAAAYCSLINGGYYYQPHLVKRIETNSGEVVKNIDATLVKQTITEETSERLRQYMFKTVKEGTATKVGVSGYEIGGKTGTAEKIPRGTDLYVISFVGFAPIDDPQFLIYVLIDEPHVEAVGSSAPVCYLAHDILKDILPYLNVFPAEDANEPGQNTTAPDIDEHAVSTEANSLMNSTTPREPKTEPSTEEGSTGGANP